MSDETRTCPDCGATLPAEAPAGACPRCLMGVVRGFELEWLIRPDASFDELRRRLEVSVDGLLGSGAPSSRRPAARGRGRVRAT